METPTIDYSSLVDTSRPFRSVKEAIAIFGKRILVGEIYSPNKPYYTPPPSYHETSWMFSSPSPIIYPKEDDQEQKINDNNELLYTLKKLESELEQTKLELQLLKERESETEIAVASLNAELHKNMSKLAEAEAVAAAKKAAAAARRVSFEMEKKEDASREEEKKRDFMIRMETSPSLAQILSLGERKGCSGGKKERKKMMKKKPTVLIGNLFFPKKGSSNKTLGNPPYAAPDGVF